MIYILEDLITWPSGRKTKLKFDFEKKEIIIDLKNRSFRGRFLNDEDNYVQIKWTDGDVWVNYGVTIL